MAIIVDIDLHPNEIDRVWKQTGVAPEDIQSVLLMLRNISNEKQLPTGPAYRIIRTVGDLAPVVKYISLTARKYGYPSSMMWAKSIVFGERPFFYEYLLGKNPDPDSLDGRLAIATLKGLGVEMEPWF